RRPADRDHPDPGAPAPGRRRGGVGAAPGGRVRQRRRIPRRATRTAAPAGVDDGHPHPRPSGLRSGAHRRGGPPIRIPPRTGRKPGMTTGTTGIAEGATAAERTLVLAALAAPSATERTELIDSAKEVTDWAGLLDLARRNATVPLVQRRLAAEGLFDLVPAPVRSGFAAVTDRIAEVNDRRLAAALEVLRRFDERGVRCVVLKGMLFSTEIYHDPRYKRMNDLDILVEVDQID